MRSTKANTAQTILLAGTMLLTVATTFTGTANAADYDGPQITFEQVYANPDDQQLNLNYARQQAAAGDFISAAAALERMLYAQPDWDSARLFYALVLYKLDDRQAAFAELDTLENRPLSPDQRAQAKAYRNQFSEAANSGKSDNLSGRIAVGVRYDDNAGNALIDDFLVFANQSDTSAFVQGNIQFSTPVSANGNLKFRAGINGQARRHETFSRSDYDMFGGNAGFSGDISEGLAWAADAQVMQINIGSTKYLTQYGGQIKLTKSFSAQTTGWVSGGWYDQDYNNLSFTFVEPTRSGDKILILAGVKHRFNENANFALSAGYEDKSATNPLFAYDGFRASGNFFNGFDNGIYARGNATYRNLSYGGPSPVRKDNHINGRLGLGASFNTIGSWIGMSPNTSMNHLYTEIAGNYINRDSNVAGLKYENVGAELTFLWEF